MQLSDRTTILAELYPQRYYAAMPMTPQAVGLHLTVPVHVHQILNDRAPIELGCTPEDVLEALAEELCSSEQLRAFVAG
jgi:hypothetical protein